MKKIIVILLFFVGGSFSTETPFSRGVNLTGWFQVSGVKQVQFTKFTKQDFININSLGCDVIRLPINLVAMSDGAPDYTIDPLFYYFMDQIIEWAEDLNMYLILDNHATEKSVFTDANLEASLIAMWSQVATRYKARSDYIIYEIINEPHDISDSVWNGIQQNVLAAIRAIDQKHTIIVTPAGWGSYNNLKHMPVFEDDNLIYSFHFYDPFIFTHQGASWTTPSLVPLSGVPFPYDAALMPACPPELVGTWVEGNIRYSYKTDGTAAKVKQLIDIAVNFSNERNVPVYCGEFGVYIPLADNDDRVYWYNVVTSYLAEKNVPWTMWDYKGSFGLFKPDGSDMFEYDVNVELVEAMGLTAPEQKEYNFEPDSVGFDLFTDFFAGNINSGSWSSGGIIDYYNEEAVIGSFCILMQDVPQYSSLGFYFTPVKDLTELVELEYALDLWLKSDSENLKIDIRFVDTKSDAPEDHPWRMKITVDQSLGQWDGEWKHIQIPLSDFQEGGSWDDAWFDPRGEFDWTQVQKLEIVAEHHNFDNQSLWIDNVRIVDPAIVNVQQDGAAPGAFELKQNYPNPFNPTTVIQYTLAKSGDIELSVYNLSGQKVRTLINETQQAEIHSAMWDGLDAHGRAAASGVYLYQLKAGDVLVQKKMTLLR